MSVSFLMSTGAVLPGTRGSSPTSGLGTYADDPDFELAIAEAEEHNRAYRVDMTGLGHGDEPESSQQRFGNFSELDDDYDFDVEETARICVPDFGVEETACLYAPDSGDDGQVRVNSEASYRPASSLGRPFQVVFVPQVEAVRVNRNRRTFSSVTKINSTRSTPSKS